MDQTMKSYGPFLYKNTQVRPVPAPYSAFTLNVAGTISLSTDGNVLPRAYNCCLTRAAFRTRVLILRWSLPDPHASRSPIPSLAESNQVSTSACARHHQRREAGRLSRTQTPGLPVGPCSSRVPGSGEFRLPPPPGHRADLKVTLIVALAACALQRTFSFPVPPPGSLTVRKAVGQLPAEWAGTARQLPGPRPASPQPWPEAPEPLGRRRGLILRLRKALHLSRHPIDTPLGSGQSL